MAFVQPFLRLSPFVEEIFSRTFWFWSIAMYSHRASVTFFGVLQVHATGERSAKSGRRLGCWTGGGGAVRAQPALQTL